MNITENCYVEFHYALFNEEKKWLMVHGMQGLYLTFMVREI